MADDDWTAVAGPGAGEKPPGYMTRTEFAASMDRVFGKGAWKDTGAWRSQDRENQLRAQGAQTVAPGHVSAHSLGDQDAPGAHDVVVPGLTPQQVQARLRSEQFPASTTLAESAHGGQGSHLHINLAAGGSDPWLPVSGPGAGAGPDEWAPVAGPGAPEPAKRGFLEEAARVGGSALGGALEEGANVVRGGAHLADVWARGNLPSGQDHPNLFSENLAPLASGLERAGKAIEPADRSSLESVAHGAGGFVPALGAAVVAPEAGAAVFGSQGFEQAHDEAVAKGATPQVAETAGLENAGVQAALGAVPVGEFVAPLTAGLRGVVGVGGRLATTAAGDAALGAAMQTGSNLVARQNYDPDRPWYDQVPQAAGMMALGGVAVHGTHEAIGGIKGLLRPREAPAEAEPAAMPETDAVRAYAGLAPEGERPPAAAPGNENQAAPVEGDATRAPRPRTPPTEGDAVLFNTADGRVAHGRVEGIEPAEGPDGAPMLTVRTPVGVVRVPDAQAVKLPGDYEGARIAAGAPLEQMPQAIADAAEWRRAAPRGYTLFQAMKDLGGIRTVDPITGNRIEEVTGALEGVRRPGLVNNKAGLTPDAMRETLQQRGWFGEFDQTQQGAEQTRTAAPGSDVQELYDLMGRQARGVRVLHPSEEGLGAIQRRKDLDDQMQRAGVSLTTPPAEAAAKLAAWRGGEVKTNGAEMEALRARAEALGVHSRKDAPYDELLADVVEREAIQGEADGDDADHYEGLIDAELTPEEHEWLTAASRGAGSVEGEAFPPEGSSWEPWPNHGEAEGAVEPGENPAGGGEDQEAPGEEPVTDADRAARYNRERMAADDAMKAFDFETTFPPEIDRAGRPRITDLEDVKSIHDETATAVLQALNDAYAIDEHTAHGLDPSNGKPIKNQQRRDALAKERYDLSAEIDETLGDYEKHFGPAARRRFEAILRARDHDDHPERDPGAPPKAPEVEKAEPSAKAPKAPAQTFKDSYKWGQTAEERIRRADTYIREARLSLTRTTDLTPELIEMSHRGITEAEAVIAEAGGEAPVEDDNLRRIRETNEANAKQRHGALKPGELDADQLAARRYAQDRVQSAELELQRVQDQPGGGVVRVSDADRAARLADYQQRVADAKTTLERLGEPVDEKVARYVEHFANAGPDGATYEFGTSLNQAVIRSDGDGFRVYVMVDGHFEGSTHFDTLEAAARDVAHRASRLGKGAAPKDQPGPVSSEKMPSGAKNSRVGATMEVQQGSDGRWRANVSYSTANPSYVGGPGHELPDPGHATRKEAELDAANDLRHTIDREVRSGREKAVVRDFQKIGAWLDSKWPLTPAEARTRKIASLDAEADELERTARSYRKGAAPTAPHELDNQAIADNFDAQAEKARAEADKLRGEPETADKWQGSPEQLGHVNSAAMYHFRQRQDAYKATERNKIEGELKVGDSYEATNTSGKPWVIERQADGQFRVFEKSNEEGARSDVFKGRADAIRYFVDWTGFPEGSLRAVPLNIASVEPSRHARWRLHNSDDVLARILGSGGDELRVPLAEQHKTHKSDELLIRPSSDGSFDVAIMRQGKPTSLYNEPTARAAADRAIDLGGEPPPRDLSPVERAQAERAQAETGVPVPKKRLYPSYTTAELKKALENPKLTDEARAKMQGEITAREAGTSKHAVTPQVLPGIERQDIGGETVQQQLLAGGERSAQQAAKAREGPLRAKTPQKDAGELFGAPEPVSDDLFADPWKPTEPPEAPPKDIAATPEAKEAQAKAERTGDGYGEKNTLFTKEAADEARQRLRDKFRNQLNAGLDPDLVRDGVILAGYHIEAGARKFGDFARAMLDDLGDGARPYLKMWYEMVRHTPGMDAEGLTPETDITPAVIQGVAPDVRGRGPDLEPPGEGATPPDGDGPKPLPPGPGQAQRGAGSPGNGDAQPGDRAAGGLGVPDGGAPPVGEGGDRGLQPGASGDRGQPAGGGEPSGGDVARDEGVQPDRTPAEEFERASDESAHLEPVSQGAHPDAESVDAPPVPRDIEADLPTLFPEQRADVAFAEQRFDEPDGHGVMFTNGTGTGKTFTGGGVIKRALKRGEKHILVVAPTQGILNHWLESLEALHAPFKILEGLDDNGGREPVVGTTYANLANNRTLADRPWQTIVADESHTLSSDQFGSETTALANFRAITNHPDRLARRGEMQLRIEADKVDALRAAIPENDKGVSATSGPAYDAWRKARQVLDDKIAEKVKGFRAEPRGKAVFLSATPFAYDKSVDYGHGYLFDYGPEPKDRGYNTPSAQQAFMIRHFGYHMKTGKLNRPEAAVESEVMERQFHEWLRRTGALSGRVLNVDKDYDRKFALVADGIGSKIDQAVDFLRNADDHKFAQLAHAFDKKFDYLGRARLLEAIKASHAIGRIRAHHALGRKVVVFHNYNEGGGRDPFSDLEHLVWIVDGKPVPAKPLYDEFLARNPYVKDIQEAIPRLGSPIEQLTGAFPDALVYNGTVSKGNREKAKQLFNQDGGRHNLIIVQSEAGQAGISLHDTSGAHQRAIENLGLPGRPTAAIQQEGRIYRIGQASDAIFRYMNTGTNWERRAFATTIAQRAGTAENLALGEKARALRQSFIDAFLDSAPNPPARGEGRGGKAADRALAKAMTEFQKAKSFYFAEGKKGGRRDSREGKDYFATPEPLGLKMVEWADVRPGDKVLEPSAGHGAIARFFPETADRTLIEPSSTLASRAALSSPGADVLEHRFEDLHAVNKYDAIVMNPPFGHAGATAIEHLAKAVNHLRDGGRIVAILPRGAADAKFDTFMESPGAKGVYQVADINLPAVTFERAGTKVQSRVVVLERQNDSERAQLLQDQHRDYSGTDKIAEFFDRIEDSTLKERVRVPREQAEGALPGLEGASKKAPVTGGFENGQTIHSKTGEPLYVATAREKMSAEDYKSTLAAAKAHGGYYSSFRGRGAIPGFQFKTAADRDAFVREAAPSAPKFQRDAVEPRDLFAGIEPVEPRATEGVFAKPALDPGRKHFDQNHADLYRLGTTRADPAARDAEANRLAAEMGRFMDWSDEELPEAGRKHLEATGEPTGPMMKRAAREYAEAFDAAGKQSWYDADAYHDLLERWYEHQGGERPKLQAERAAAPVFYSAVERTVARSPTQSATAEQWKATLRNASGVKAEELNWMGVDEWLDLFQGAKVTKEALQAFVRDHGVKVEEKTLSKSHEEFDPEDYHTASRISREFDKLQARRREELEAQAERSGADSDEAEEWVEDEMNDAWGELHDEAEQAVMSEWRSEQDANQPEFGDRTLPGGEDYHELLLTLPQVERPPATHWDTEGVMAHVRFNERQAPDGKRVLFIEEVQSDWHQKGRDQGYKAAPDPIRVERTTQMSKEADDDETAAREALATHAQPLLEHAYRVALEGAARATDALRAAESGEQAPGAPALNPDRYAANVQAAREAKIRATKALENVSAAKGLVDDRFADTGRLTGAIMRARAAFEEDSPLDDKGLEDFITAAQQATLHANEARQEWQRATNPGGIADAPFKSSWPALVMKRVIRWAVDHDFERVAWTTGAQQGERYNLTKHIGRVTFQDASALGLGEADLRKETTRGQLIVHDPAGGRVMERYIGGHDPEQVRRGLEEHIGKELTDRLLNAEARQGHDVSGWRNRTRSLEGLDLKVGDEGMRQFYDRNLVNITNDIIKRHGAKVETVDLAQQRAFWKENPDLAALSTSDLQDRFREARDANDNAREMDRLHRALELRFDEEDPKSQPRVGAQHGFDITDKMREAAAGGFPLFQRDGHVGFRDRGAHLTDDLYGVPADLEGQAKAIIAEVNDIVARIAPHAKPRAFEKLSIQGESLGVHGASYRRAGRQIIAWSLESKDAPGTARHEAIHALREAGLFTDDEWKILERAAVDQGWLDKYDVAAKYHGVGWEAEIEEAIAFRFQDYRRGDFARLPAIVRTAFQKIADVLRATAAAWRRTFGGAETYEDVFGRVESGEVGDRARRPDAAPAPARTPERAPALQRADRDREMRSRAPGDVVNRILGHGVDSVLQRVSRAADRALPDPVLELGDAIKLGASPMGSGSARAQAAAKDFANNLRTSAHQWDRLDQWIQRTFSTEQQQRMWSAADEEGVLRRRGVTPGHEQGFNRLTAEELNAVRALQERADAAFAQAQRLKMVNSEGLESYVPRMVVQMTALGPKTLSKSPARRAKEGGNLFTSTGQLRHRKYETVEETEAAAKEHFGSGALVVRNIRTLGLSTAKLEQAIAGRTLVDKIKAMASEAGGDTVVEGGGNPNPGSYFTLDHPALTTWRPRFITDQATGKVDVARDQNDAVIFEAHPVWVSREFEGPLRAVLSTPSNSVVRALVELKGKMMSVIMYSPLMHNAVIWGKAIPADPKGVLTLQTYKRGNEAKRDPATMKEALQAGLDPIGRRYFNQDVTAIAEGANIVPGRSWTSQVLAYIPGLFDRQAGELVKAKVDEFGDLWHNTFLWDRVADLQMGLYVHIRDQLRANGNQTGVGERDAQRVAAHFANRYAGSLPIESMSKLARTTANIMLFSRSFTLGNLAAYKDIVMGLPSDVRSQVARDSGPAALARVQGIARQKALGMLAMDVALSYVGLFLAAGAVAFLTHQKFQPPWDNETGKEKRFLIGYQPDGTGIYGRLPTGKVGEELQDWVTDPRELLLRKLSPYGRLMYAMSANDEGFGQKLFDPYDHTPLGWAKNIGRVVWFTMAGVAPMGQIQGATDAITGRQDQKTALLQTLAPAAGITISKGAPGGPAMADFFEAKDRHDFAVQKAMPDIRRQIQAGDLVGARAKMTQLGISPGLQRYYIKVAKAPGSRLSGRKLADFLRMATPEEKAQMERDRADAAARVSEAP